MNRENRSLLERVNSIVDMLLLVLAMTVSYVIRFGIFKAAGEYRQLPVYLLLLMLLIPMYYLVFQAFDLFAVFRFRRFTDKMVRLLQANVIMAGVLTAVTFVLKDLHLSRWVIGLYFVISLLLLIAKHLVLRWMVDRAQKKGIGRKTVLLLGSGRSAKEYLDLVERHPEYMHDVIGYISSQPRLSIDYLGGFDRLYDILNEKKPEEVICALSFSEAEYLQRVMADCEKTGTKVSIIPFCYRYIPTKPQIDQMGRIPMINPRKVPLDNLFNAFLKRTMDICGSLALILLTSPIMLFAAIGVKVTSPGPVIFKQVRVGLNKKHFTMYKFRSMRVNDRSDTAWSTNNDPRKTKFGSFIRKYSIDELPQFFNVLKGDMSLVGPRPELPYFVQNFQETVPLYMVKHLVKPGITGLAQVKGYRGDTSIPKRIEWDVHYIENWNLFLDIKILLMTVFKGLRNEEALVYEEKEKKGEK